VRRVYNNLSDYCTKLACV